jgi:hypothetical protein
MQAVQCSAWCVVLSLMEQPTGINSFTCRPQSKIRIELLEASLYFFQFDFHVQRSFISEYEPVYRVSLGVVIKMNGVQTVPALAQCAKRVVTCTSLCGLSQYGNGGSKSLQR